MLDLSLVQSIRRIVLALLFAPLLLSLLVIQSATPIDSGPHLATEILGWAAIAACIAGRTWCSLYIAGRKASKLVQDGPYSLVRNPLYVFSILGAAGVGLSTGSLTMAVVFPVVVIAVFVPVVSREETHLREHLGAPYEDYMGRTPRWTPRFSNWRSATSLEISPRLVARTFFDAIWIALLIPALEVVEKLQSLGLLPVFLKVL